MTDYQIIAWLRDRGREFCHSESKAGLTPALAWGRAICGEASTGRDLGQDMQDDRARAFLTRCIEALPPVERAQIEDALVSIRTEPIGTGAPVE